MDIMRALLDIDPFSDYPLEMLKKVSTPPSPRDFERFWQVAYQQALTHSPKATLRETGKVYQHFKICELSFQSTHNMTVKGWLLVPLHEQIKRAFVFGHGYAGRDGPDYHLLFPDAVLYFPCCRGIAQSACASISQDPYWHVLHDINDKDNYIIRGCVEDIWLSVSVLEDYFPAVKGRIGLLGTSFGGGIGVLALAQDKRISKAHFNLPTFGHHRLRLRIATQGSGRSIQDFYQRDPYTLIRTLRYYDAAFAAASITVPVHFALALRDSFVTPPGQFAIYNQVKKQYRKLMVLDAGHESYPNEGQQFTQLNKKLFKFFSDV